MFRFIESAAAQGTNFSIENPLKAENLGDLLVLIANGIVSLAIPVAAAMYIWSGLLFMTGGQYPNNYAKAKKIFGYTTLGLVIILIGGGFVDLIKSILNLGQ